MAIRYCQGLVAHGWQGPRGPRRSVAVVPQGEPLEMYPKWDMPEDRTDLTDGEVGHGWQGPRGPRRSVASVPHDEPQEMQSKVLT